MTLKVAIVGYGLSGRSFHAPLLAASSDFEVVAIVSSRIDEVKKDFPQARICSFEEAVKVSDVVVLATPHQLHYEQAFYALHQQKHVVVEKPFTATLEQAHELFELAQKCKLVLAVFHNRRFDADFLTIQHMIKEKTLGDIVTIESHFDRFRPSPKENAWRENKGPQSGVWWDLGPHLIDQALQLMGTPRDIDFDIGMQRDGQADDFFNVTLKYEQGRRIHLRASCIVKDFGFRFRVHGTKGSALFRSLDVQEDQLRSGMDPRHEDFGYYQASDFEYSAPSEMSLQRGCYGKFYVELNKAIKTQSEFCVSAGAVFQTTSILLGNKSF